MFFFLLLYDFSKVNLSYKGFLVFIPRIMRVNRKRAKNSAVGKTEFPFKVCQVVFAHVTNYNYCGRQCAHFPNVLSSGLKFTPNNQFCGLPKFNMNIFSALCSPDYVCRNGQLATSKFRPNKDLESPK